MQSAAFYSKRTPAELIYDLAFLLKRCQLSLIVGAGVSRDLGMPLWRDLAKQCLQMAGFKETAESIDQFTTTSKLLELMGLVTRQRDYAQYIDLVHAAIYSNGMPDSLGAKPLLRALGALCMGSTRGRITDIINYNFDCILEQYFICHGYVIQVLSDVPTLTAANDVRIWHPHGYVPFDKFSGAVGQISSKLVFDSESADDFLKNRNQPWMDVLRFMYVSKVFLAVGLSGEDPMTNLVLDAASKAVDESRPIGFWLHKKGDIPPDVIKKLTERSIVTVAFDDFGEYPEYLMRVCALAAGPTL